MSRYFFGLVSYDSSVYTVHCTVGTLPSTFKCPTVYCLGTSMGWCPLALLTVEVESLLSTQGNKKHLLFTDVQHNIILAYIFIICCFFAGLNPSFLGSEKPSANVDRFHTSYNQCCTKPEPLGKFV